MLVVRAPSGVEADSWIELRYAGYSLDTSYWSDGIPSNSVNMPKLVTIDNNS